MSRKLTVPKRVSVEKLLDLADQAFRKHRFKEAAQYYKSSQEDALFFYALFMEALSYFLDAQLGPFKRTYKILHDRYEENRFIRELDCFISLKKDPLEAILENWLNALEKYPKSRKLKRALRRIQKEKDPSILIRHSKLSEFVSYPKRNFRPRLLTEIGDKEKKEKFRKSPGQKEGRGYNLQFSYLKKIFSVAGLFFLLFFLIQSLKHWISQDLSSMASYWYSLYQKIESILIPEKVYSLFTPNEEKPQGIASDGREKKSPDEENRRKNEHLRILLGNEKSQLEPDSPLAQKKITEKEINENLTRARKLLRLGDRNRALIVLNDSYARTDSYLLRERIERLKTIALSLHTEKMPEFMPIWMVNEQAGLYHGCTVNWQGRLDRILNEGDGSFLLITAQEERAENIKVNSSFLAYMQKPVGIARIGSLVHILGEVTSFPRGRKFERNVDENIKVLIHARQMRFD